jgi:hypothetical protein
MTIQLSLPLRQVTDDDMALMLQSDGLNCHDSITDFPDII